jgi:NADPH-dependent curcumin reductase CurA
MADSINRKIVLSSRPVGIPRAEHFSIEESPIPELAEGQFLLRNKFLSVSPAMRGWVNAVKNYSIPVAIGEVMRANSVGEVIASRHADYKEGDNLVGMFGWQSHAVGDGSEVSQKIEPKGAPLSAYLGILGVSGLTAYFGLLDIGEPKPGETVVVSTAAGSVGSVVGQIAKIKGGRAVGITGSDEKVKLCVQGFGYDAAVNYKAPDFADQLAQACPDGVNIYYDNTAGTISDTVYSHLAMRARCIVCGTISVESWDPPPPGPRIERYILVNRARFQGFVIYDYRDRWPEAQGELTNWLNEGKLTYREDILDGLEQAPTSIERLYAGENMGKLSIQI